MPITYYEAIMTGGGFGTSSLKLNLSTYNFISPLLHHIFFLILLEFSKTFFYTKFGFNSVDFVIALIELLNRVGDLEYRNDYTFSTSSVYFFNINSNNFFVFIFSPTKVNSSVKGLSDFLLAFLKIEWPN